MWIMLSTTILFAFMAVIQVKNQRRLEKFKVNVATSRESILDTTVDNNLMKQPTLKVDTPWHFWKWIIVATLRITTILFT